MTRSAAAIANEAADALLAWLHDQPPRGRPDEPRVFGPSPSAAEPGPVTAAAPQRPPAEGAEAGAATPEFAPEGAGSDPSWGARDAETGATLGAGGDLGQGGNKLRLAHPDWLYHHLAITGPAPAVASFRSAAAGAGIIPWPLDLDRLEEDCFYRLVAPPAPHRRTLSLAGARILARQLRVAVQRRHELALAQVGRSRACPFDLHALIPVPDEVLELGRDDPAALSWLWTHWGTTEALRHVAADPDAEPERRQPPAEGRQPAAGEAAFRVSFWSADWTPWSALASLVARWPALRFTVRPTYEP
jgi:hypothetical protein